MRGRTRVTALLSALVGAGAVLLVPVLSPGVPGMEQAGPLLGAWLCIGALIQWSRLRRTPMGHIPIAFHGTTGPFRLRVRRRGREVTVLRGMRVVAEARATRRGDRLVVHPDRVDDGELAALGVAIGQAMQVVAGEPIGRAEESSSPVRPRRRSGLGDPGRSGRAVRPGTNPGWRPARAAYRPLVALTRRELVKWRLEQQP